MNGQHSGTSHDEKLVYQHFRLPGHSHPNMKVQVLKRVHNKFGSTKRAKPERERVELKWIKELGTAAPYGLNDMINGAGALISLSTTEVNRVGICNKQISRRRSHGHRKSTSPPLPLQKRKKRKRLRIYSRLCLSLVQSYIINLLHMKI